MSETRFNWVAVVQGVAAILIAGTVVAAINLWLDVRDLKRDFDEQAELLNCLADRKNESRLCKVIRAVQRLQITDEGEAIFRQEPTSGVGVVDYEQQMKDLRELVDGLSPSEEAAVRSIWGDDVLGNSRVGPGRL